MSIREGLSDLLTIMLGMVVIVFAVAFVIALLKADAGALFGGKVF